MGKYCGCQSEHSANIEIFHICKSNVLKQRGYKSNLLHFLVDLEHLQRLHNLAANLTLDWSDITQNKQGQLAYSF